MATSRPTGGAASEPSPLPTTFRGRRSLGSPTNFALLHRSPYMRHAMPDTALMSIPGRIDPVPVARDITPRADGRVDLIGLPMKRLIELLAGAGLDAKQAKLRGKQVFHWLYHRGVTDFEAMTDIAKTMRPWLTERFVIGRPEIVEAQHSSDGTRKWLLRTADGTSRWCSFPTFGQCLGHRARPFGYPRAREQDGLFVIDGGGALSLPVSHVEGGKSEIEFPPAEDFLH